mgnify:CR=1 FL=1
MTPELEWSDHYLSQYERHEHERGGDSPDWLRKLRRSGIDAKNLFEVGDPSQTVVNMAGDNHLIIMGASSRSPIKKFFKGSKPLDVMGNCNCPILIVK